MPYNIDKIIALFIFMHIMPQLWSGYNWLWRTAPKLPRYATYLTYITLIPIFVLGVIWSIITYKYTLATLVLYPIVHRKCWRKTWQLYATPRISVHSLR